MGKEPRLPYFGNTLQLAFNNALAVYGLVPMVSLMVEYHNRGMGEEMGYCKNALLRISSDTRFKDIIQGNAVVFMGDKPVSPKDWNIYDVALVQLGYYEKYDTRNLVRDMQGIVDFVNSLL